MLKRLYADNYKALVNFEIELGSLALLLGPNGSGKSTAFEVVRLLRDFVDGERTTTELFSWETPTRWQTRNVQTFELMVVGNGGTYVYRLELEHDTFRKLCRIKREILTFDSRPLYESKLDQAQLHAQLYRDDGSKGPEVLADWTRSALASIQPRAENTLLTWFKEKISRVLVMRIDPIAIDGRSEKEETTLTANTSNFTSWFRHVAQLNLNLMADLSPVLKEVLPGFESLRLIPDGADAKLLKARFRIEPDEKGKPQSYECRFDEMSEGQRVLVVLYTLLTNAFEDDYTLCLDEPENFVALREIQPWLNMLIDKTQTQSCQAVLISHHPELINALAVGTGLWLDRSSGGHVRVQKVSDDNSGLPVAELIARGWLNA